MYFRGITLSRLLGYLLMINGCYSPRTYHLLVKTRRLILYACFPSSEDFAEEFRRKGIAFNRALEGLEDRAKKCESLKVLVS